MQDLSVTLKPFPHLVVDGLWPEADLRAVLEEFPDPSFSGWKRYSNSQERKLEGPAGIWGPETRAFFQDLEKLGPDLSLAFGLPELHMETIGGGYHCIEPGGYLAVHADFNRSPVTNRYRRLNVLVYLNDGWNEPESGGNLQLWDDIGPVADIAPEFNRTVVFQTSDRSWHGHPHPANRWRRSVAAYFFTDEAPEGYHNDHSTVWHA